MPRKYGLQRRRYRRRISARRFRRRNPASLFRRRRTYRLRRRVRRGVYRRRRVPVPTKSLGNLWPTRLRVKLPYNVRWTDSHTGPTGWIFRGNSIYDPDYSLGGSAAIMLSLLSEFYTRYHVRGSSISITSVNTSASGSIGDLLIYQSIAAVRNPGSTTDVDPWGQNVHKRRFYKNKLMPIVAAPGMPRNTRPLRMYMSTRTILAPGPGSQAVSGDSVTAPTNDNPTSQWFWRISFAPKLLQNWASFHDLRLRYYVEFYHYKETLGDV